MRAIEVKEHWNKIYAKNAEDKLGWYETDLSPALRLMKEAKLSLDARILIVGAGSTNLIDELFRIGYKHLIATDISEVALKNLSSRLLEQGFEPEIIIDDLTKPKLLTMLHSIDLWIDRAVLHFFTQPLEQKQYFDLLRKTVKPGGYAILAEFNLSGAARCSGLDVCRYDKKLLHNHLSSSFRLIDSFNYIYTMPSGDLRPYIYTLFKKED